MKKERVSWTFEKCKENALRCKTLKDFRTQYGRAYIVARKNNWIYEICLHMIKSERLVQWTEQNCFNEALKYFNRSDFFYASPRAYEVLRKNKLLDIACKHMRKPYEDNFKWSKEKCQAIALKYQHRLEFQIGDKRAYESAKHNGWLNDICQHMKFLKLPNGYWNNIENCRIKALEYQTKTEFFKNSPHIYKISLKNNWLDDICQHMIPIGDKYKRCIYAYEFPDNHVYVGLTCNLNRRKYDRNQDDNDVVTIYKNKTNLIPIIKQLTDYIPVDMAIKLENEYLQKYITDGWISLNRRKTGGIGSGTPVWNFNRMKKFVSKYNNLKSFVNDDVELYEIAKRSDWIYSLFPNEI